MDTGSSESFRQPQGLLEMNGHPVKHCHCTVGSKDLRATELVISRLGYLYHLGEYTSVNCTWLMACFSVWLCKGNTSLMGTALETQKIQKLTLSTWLPKGRSRLPLHESNKTEVHFFPLVWNCPLWGSLQRASASRWLVYHQLLVTQDSYRPPYSRQKEERKERTLEDRSCTSRSTREKMWIGSHASQLTRPFRRLPVVCWGTS